MAAANTKDVNEDEGDTIIVSSPRSRERTLSSTSASLVQERDDKWRVERTNLLNIAKICIKTLIDSSLKCGRTLTDDFSPLHQLFIVMEHILRHGLKGIV